MTSSTEYRLLLVNSTVPVNVQDSVSCWTRQLGLWSGVWASDHDRDLCMSIIMLFLLSLRLTALRLCVGKGKAIADGP